MNPEHAAPRTHAPSPSWLRAARGALLYLPVVVPAAAVGVGLASLLGQGPRFLRRRPVLTSLITVGATVALVRSQLGRFFVEQPKYSLERVLDGLEIRAYGPRVVAETTIVGPDRDAALNEGFRRLAGYIFGANEAKVRIAMTSPVTAAAARGASGTNGSERIAMTSPVTARADEGGYTVTFTLPAGRTLESFPAPKDGRVRLREVPGERVAVLTYSGAYGARLVEKKNAELLERVRAAGLDPRGEPVFAGYDPPSTLPMLRRNEAQVAIA